MECKADSGGASSGPFHDWVVVLPTFVCVMYFTESEKFFKKPFSLALKQARAVSSLGPLQFPHGHSEGD